MADQISPETASARPWEIDPDERPGMEWNVHIVERDRPHMRVCFMTSGPEAEANAALIVAAVNAYDGHAQTPDQWRPIETAKRSIGKHLRMFGDGDGIHGCEYIGVWHDYGGRGYWVEAFSNRRIRPTHWMEIGSPPASPDTSTDHEGK